MADIVFQPDQQVPAGRYYVILRPVEDNDNNNNGNQVMMPPAQPPLMNGEDNQMQNMPPARVPNVRPANIPEVDPNGNNNYNLGGGKRNKNSKKVKKAKGTRKLSGYMKFAQEVRPRILKENPALRTDIPSIGRKIGQMWRELSDAEKARY